MTGGQRKCADNEGKRKGEVVKNGDKGSVSAQRRREQMKEWSGDVSKGRWYQEPELVDVKLEYTHPTGKEVDALTLLSNKETLMLNDETPDCYLSG